MSASRPGALDVPGAPGAVFVGLEVGGVLLVVLLVVILGGIKRARRDELGDDGLVVLAGFDERGLAVLGGLLFVVVAVENGGAVLGARVGELAVDRRGVDVVPEHVEQLRVGHFLRVVEHLDGFRMAGFAAGNVLVARRGGLAAGVADDRFLDALHAVKGVLHTPETSAREKGGLELGGGGRAVTGRGGLLGGRRQRHQQRPRKTGEDGIHEERETGKHTPFPCHRIRPAYAGRVAVATCANSRASGTPR